eukprot:gene9178-10133_t
MSKDLTEGQNFTLGTVAALVEGIILQPTLYWKNARAQKLPFTLNPRLLYRGTAASIFNEMQMMGVQFGLTGWFEKVLHDKEAASHVITNEHTMDIFTHPPSTGCGGQEMANKALDAEKQALVSHQNTMKTFISACLGGLFSAVFSSPIELIMIQQQKYGGNFLMTPINIVKQHGLFSHGFFRGTLSTAYRDTIYAFGLLGITPFVQNKLEVEYQLSQSTASFYASMIGGIIGAVPSHPLDLIKTCMQGDLAGSTYKGMISTAKLLWKQGGLVRFFDGVMWRTVNITATVYIANECRNLLSSHVQKLDI